MVARRKHDIQHHGANKSLDIIFKSYKKQAKIIIFCLFFYVFFNGMTLKKAQKTLEKYVKNKRFNQKTAKKPKK